MGNNETWKRFENAMQGEHSGWSSMRQNVRLKSKEEKAMEQKRKELRVSAPKNLCRYAYFDEEEKAWESIKELERMGL